MVRWAALCLAAVLCREYSMLSSAIFQCALPGTFVLDVVGCEVKSLCTMFAELNNCQARWDITEGPTKMMFACNIVPSETSCQ